MKRSLVLALILHLALTLACNGASQPSPDPSTPEPTRSPTSTARPIPKVRLLAEPELVFDASEQACPQTTAPDLPVRPFRAADGMINLNLSSPINYRMIGPDFNSLEVDCHPTLSSTLNPDPAQFNFSEWISAVYTTDGKTVHALIHNEYHGDVGAQWDSERDFSANQMANNWGYYGWDGSGYRQMSFDEANQRWQGHRPLCQISRWGMHPDLGCQPTLQWTSPIDGTVTIYGEVSNDLPETGNGISARITKGEVELWQQTIEPGGESTYPFNFEIEVEQGDPIRFQVDARGDSTFDSTRFRAQLDPEGNLCPSGDRTQCLMASLTYAVSTDGGRTFTQPTSPDHYVASAPKQYQSNWGSIARWQPSKIVHNPDDGYYYVLVHRIDDPPDPNQSLYAACVMRSPDPADPSSWRAWDGEGFNLKFPNPYQQEITKPDQVECAVVSDHGLTYDLTYNTYLDQFIAVGHASGYVGTSGFYFTLSDDLVNWSSVYLIMSADFAYTTTEGIVFAYPSLVDHESDSRTFDTTGQRPYLYYTRFNVRSLADVDLLRVPIEFMLTE